MKLNLKPVSTAIAESIQDIPTSLAETLVESFCQAELNPCKATAQALCHQLDRTLNECGTSDSYYALNGAIKTVATYLAGLKREYAKAHPIGFSLGDRAHSILDRK